MRSVAGRGVLGGSLDHRHGALVRLEPQELELWTRGATWTRRLFTDGALTLSTGAVIRIDELYAKLPP